MSGPRDLPAELAGGVERLTEAALAGDGLPAKVKHLGLAFAFANKGRDEDARREGELAVADGLTRAEAAEALCAGVLSRGTSVITANEWLLEASAPAESQIAGESSPDAEAILAYFDQTFGAVPGWLSRLVESSPPTLESYYSLRAEIMRDAALPRAHKELILVTINSAERYDVGMTVHMNGALDAGAVPEQVLEAVRASIPAGGMVAWIAGADAYASVAESRASS